MFMMEMNSEKVIVDDKFPSFIGNKNRIIDSIINRIKTQPVAVKIDYDELFLIIDEALTNAMEHGNHWDPRKNVLVRIIKNKEYISITIEDEGDGFDIDRYYTCDMMRSLNPRGRGIHIIKHFCKPNWNDQGNQINFCIDIK
jgi:anti-sigma regulatory factor (Ser/Thr protein kinase)